VRCPDDVAPRLLQARRDPWMGEDKLQHFLLSYGITVFSFAGAELAGVEGNTRLNIAAGLAALTGIGKELSDARRGSFFSPKDLLYDALGIVAGLAMAHQIR
jgi:putative lipoprotein